MDVRTTNCQLREAATPQPSAATDDAAQLVNRARRHQLAPHAVAACLLLTALGEHALAGLIGYQALITAITAVISYGIVAVAAAIATKRKRAHRRRALAAGLTASTWLTLASLGASAPLIGVLTAVSVGFGAKHWKSLRDQAKTPPGEESTPVAEAPAPPPPPSQQEVLEERWTEKVLPSGRGVKGELVGGFSDEVGLTWTLELHDGLVLDDVVRRLPNIASLLGVGADNLQADALPLRKGEQRDESRVRLQLVTNSPVIDAVPYVVPRMIDGFAPLGPYSDGRGVAAIPILARKSVRNTVVIGSSGYGKSSLINGLAATVRANVPTVTLYMDPKGNSSPDLQHNSTVSVVGLDEAEEFTRAVEELCKGRGYEAILNDWSGFDPSRERPVYLVIIDECDMLFSLPGMGARWGKIAKICRALGIPLLLATQYAGIVAFGNSELLRSNIGNVVLMRTDSNSSDGLIAPGLPPSRSLPYEPGYGYLRAKGARRVSMRSTILRSSDDADSGHDHAGVVLARHGDASVDQIGQVALGELLFDPALRKAARKASVQEKFVKFLEGKSSAKAGEQAAATPSGAVLSFPRIGDFFPPEPVQPTLSEPERRYMETLDRLGGKPRMRDMERALNLEETRTRDLRDALLAKGLLVQLIGANGNPVKGRYGRPGTTLADGDNKPDSGEEVSATVTVITERVAARATA